MKIPAGTWLQCLGGDEKRNGSGVRRDVPVKAEQTGACQGQEGQLLLRSCLLGGKQLLPGALA